MKDDKVININYIYSLNFRISKEVIGVVEYRDGTVIDTLYKFD